MNVFLFVFMPILISAEFRPNKKLSMGGGISNKIKKIPLFKLTRLYGRVV
jgi:hypothetical protein